jgi:hypothetical protein
MTANTTTARPLADAAPLQVVPVTGRRVLKQFIRLPWSIYADDPCWVPPLLWERQQHLSRKNPYFVHARWCAWLARRGSRAVGRISAQVDQLHLDRHQDATGFFGMLEAEDDPAVFQALLTTAETWLREQGLRRILGPFNLSINDECGLLVAGFETPPGVMMGHAHPYYALRLEEQGYGQARDLLAYRIGAGFVMPAAMQTLLRKLADRVHLRPLRRSQLDEEIAILRDIFNDAWSQNWNFVPFTEAEFAHMGRDLARLLPDDFVQIAEVDGVPAAMAILMPNLNEVIRDLNGRLLPFGWLKLLWRLKWAYPKTGRVPLLGVRKRYQQSLLGAALAVLVIDGMHGPGRQRGIEEVELSWILEDNKSIRGLIEAIGGTVYKRYRIYQKELV